MPVAGGARLLQHLFVDIGRENLDRWPGAKPRQRFRQQNRYAVRFFAAGAAGSPDPDGIACALVAQQLDIFHPIRGADHLHPALDTAQHGTALVLTDFP